MSGYTPYRLPLSPVLRGPVEDTIYSSCGLSCSRSTGVSAACPLATRICSIVSSVPICYYFRQLRIAVVGKRAR
jgi:hypothetical protein